VDYAHDGTAVVGKFAVYGNYTAGAYVPAQCNHASQSKFWILSNNGWVSYELLAW
jgi:hypothetical protein